MADLKQMKGISEADRKLLEQAEEWLGAEPTNMGPVKNIFWGNVKESYYFPYPQQDAREQAECDQLLARLDEYLRNEHPAVAIDQDQEIPRWVIDRLFEVGVLGMTIPKEFGGLGLGITSYNRVLERIGMYWLTAVLVSAHQSIGCKARHALRLRGTEKTLAPAPRQRLAQRVLSLRTQRRLRCRRLRDHLHQRRERRLHHQRRKEVGDIRSNLRALHRHGPRKPTRRKGKDLRTRLPPMARRC
ncbi:MAG: acyl-CoA dehydrogenase family protein [Phycisphaeraceae bacterium]|nr:acyl-CoA dehydrogenase family protein [Phycisphaeraceae bacterium]